MFNMIMDSEEPIVYEEIILSLRFLWKTLIHINH